MRKAMEPPEFTPTGMWVDPEFLPAKARARLAEIAQSRGKATEGQAASLVRQSSEWVQLLTEQGPGDSGDKKKAGLLLVADKAHALLSAMGKLTPGMASGFSCSFDVFALASVPPRPLHDESLHLRSEEGRFLGAMWELLHDLRDVAEHASEQVVLDRTMKPDQNAARSLVYHLAHIHLGVFGRWPKAYKGHWFPEYCAAVGEAMPAKLKVGRALVDGVLHALREAAPD
jgi:hypothetical protein